MSDINSMPDAELAEALAREVMGWDDHYAMPDTHWVSGYQKSPSGADYWSPPTDYAAAFEVVERMRTMRPDKDTFPEPDPWYEFLWGMMRATGSDKRPTTSGKLDGMWLNLTPRAICEAALMAVRATEEKS